MQLTQRLTRNTLIAINFFNRDKKINRKKSEMQFILVILKRPLNNNNNTHSLLCVIVKREVHCCDFLQFVVHFYSQVILIGSFNFIFSSHYVFLGLTSCNTCMQYIKGCNLIKNINRTINRD